MPLPRFNFKLVGCDLGDVCLCLNWFDLICSWLTLSDLPNQRSLEGLRSRVPVPIRDEDGVVVDEAPFLHGRGIPEQSKNIYSAAFAALAAVAAFLLKQCCLSIMLFSGSQPKIKTLI